MGDPGRAARHDGEDPLAARQRELAEEADLAAAEWDVLADFFTSPGGSNEAIRIYLARGLCAPPPRRSRASDEEADMETRWVPLDECVDAVLARRCRTRRSSIGVLAAHASRVARLEHAWPPADAPWPRPRPNCGATRRAPRDGADAATTDAACDRGLPAARHVERGLVANTVAAYRRDLGDLRRLAGGRGIDGSRRRSRAQDVADFVRLLGADAPSRR